ncbi:MAG: GTPase ObgE [Thermoguttaceae bacterium]|nr:GTPase ObgE [Thermoguttaceae bacterium]
MFVDEAAIDVVAGKGGDGCSSFRREKYVPRGGPDGGDGGKGGDVIIRANQNVASLLQLANQRVWKAQNGEQGGSSQCHGKNGRDLVIDVPVGTMVFDLNHDLLLKDLKENEDSFIVARGGFGGKGNMRFKSATMRSPTIAQPGEKGQSRSIRLELRMIADVGLVGFPNAGKSTLLSRLTKAKPKIANYPFTTMTPHLGLAQIGPDRGFVIADIPGLIEGASEGVGLGHDFLRHIQRAGVILHLVEPAPIDGTDPISNYKAIRRELENFDEELGKRLEIVAVTKNDLPQGVEVQKRFKDELGIDAFLISAVTGYGLKALVDKIDQILKPKPRW